jgi:hypothetical protein
MTSIFQSCCRPPQLTTRTLPQKELDSRPPTDPKSFGQAGACGRWNVRNDSGVCFRPDTYVYSPACFVLCVNSIRSAVRSRLAVDSHPTTPAGFRRVRAPRQGKTQLKESWFAEPYYCCASRIALGRKHVLCASLTPSQAQIFEVFRAASACRSRCTLACGAHSRCTLAPRFSPARTHRERKHRIRRPAGR